MSTLLKFNDPTIEVPVVAKISEKGKVQQVKFIAIFDRLSRTQTKAITRQISESVMEVTNLTKELFDLDDLESDRKTEIDTRIDEIDQETEQLIRAHFKQWKNLPGSDGKVISYSEENREEVLDAMLDSEPYFIALREGLFQANGTKREEAKVKN